MKKLILLLLIVPVISFGQNPFRDYCKQNGCFDISTSWLDDFTMTVNAAGSIVRKQRKIIMELVDFN